MTSELRTLMLREVRSQGGAGQYVGFLRLPLVRLKGPVQGASRGRLWFWNQTDITGNHQALLGSWIVLRWVASGSASVDPYRAAGPWCAGGEHARL